MNNCFNGIIYKVINKINDKMYIGQTSYSLNHRINAHMIEVRKKVVNNIFHNAIRKYGIKNFEWNILIECSSQKELNSKEQFFIKKYKTLNPNGYNMTFGGKTMSGFKHKPESNLKNRLSHLGKLRSLETKQKISNSISGKNHHMYGKHHSKKTRQKMSDSHKGKKISLEHKIKWLQASWEARSKNYKIISPERKVFIIKSLRRFCLLYKLSQGSMWQVAHKLRNHYKGWKCEEL